MNKNSKFLKNVYGWDKLSLYLCILGAIFLTNRITIWAGLILIIYAIWRSLSKNISKRHLELQAFNNLLLLIRKKIYDFSNKIDNFRRYKIFKCPKCSQKLRVPRKKGNIVITCKKCGNKFKARS